MSTLIGFRCFLALIASMLTMPALASCRVVPGADNVLWKPARPIVWVGETHGTKQTPAAFGDLVCDALNHGKTVTVGLELPSQMQSVLDAMLGSGDLAAAERALFATPSWSVFADGRSSEAMLALLIRLRGLKASYPSLRVVAVEAPWENSPDAKDVALGNEIKRLVSLAPQSVLLVLTGNLHGMKLSPLPYKTSAMYLPPEQVFSLLVVSEGGTAWQSTDKGCGSQPGGTQDKILNRSYGVYADNAYAKYGVDGVLALGEPTTASPPANMAAAASSQCYKLFQAQEDQRAH